MSDYEILAAQKIPKTAIKKYLDRLGWHYPLEYHVAWITKETPLYSLFDRYDDLITSERKEVTIDIIREVLRDVKIMDTPDKFVDFTTRQVEALNILCDYLTTELLTVYIEPVS